MDRKRAVSFGGFSSLRSRHDGRRAQEEADVQKSRRVANAQDFMELHGRNTMPQGRAAAEIDKALIELRKSFPDLEISHFLKLFPIYTRKSPLGPLFEKGFRVQLQNVQESDPRIWLLIHGLLAIAVRRMLQQAPTATARGQIVMQNSRLFSPQSTRWNRLDDLSFYDLLDRLFAAKMSDDSLVLSETVWIVRWIDTSVKTFGAKTHNLSQRRSSVSSFCKRKSSLLDPFIRMKVDGRHKRAQNLCLPIAIVIAKKIADCGDMPPPPELGKFIVSPVKRIEAAIALVRDAGLRPVQGPFSIDDVEQFSKVLSNYRILCFVRGAGPPFVTYGHGPKICLFFDTTSTHVYVIRNLRAFFGNSGNSGHKLLCEECWSHYDARASKHLCQASKCDVCRDANCANKELPSMDYQSKCDDCYSLFKTPACLETHMSAKTCRKRIKCKVCAMNICSYVNEPTDKQITKAQERHRKKCGLRYCKFCKNCATFDHLCTMQRAKVTEQPESANMMRFYADIESELCDKTSEHLPNLLVIQRAAFTPDEKQSNPNAVYDQLIFRGPHCIDDFLDLLISHESPFKHSYILFFNLSGYDGHLVLQKAISKHLELTPLLKNQRVMSMEHKPSGTIFRDAALYIPNTSLSMLPKMFKLPPECSSKGMFPYCLNSQRYLENVHYEDAQGERFPPLRFFEPHKMREENRKALESWWASEHKRYANNPRLRYDIYEELTNYCKLDTLILHRAFEAYLTAFEDRFPGLCPLESLTLAAHTNKIFRTLYLQEGQIALIQPGGLKANTSKLAMAWLAELRQRLRLQGFRSARHNGEVSIQGRPCDGYGYFIDEAGERRQVVAEYFGCYWHSHSISSECTIKIGSPASPLRYQRTLERLESLKELANHPESPYGRFELVYEWECQFKRRMQREPNTKRFVKEYCEGLHSEVLNPRRAISGGKVEVIRHLVEVDEVADEAIEYVDFTSLYPSVNACTETYQFFPVGSPEIYVSIEIKQRWPNLSQALLDNECVGLLFCKVEAPCQLYNPILPLHHDGKLVFSLCLACTIEVNESPCRHSTSERALTGHWTSVEVGEALRLGYILLDCYEVYHFPNRSQTLFRNFIHENALYKEYASGFGPEVDQSDEQSKQAYAENISQSLGGIAVDVSKFVSNPALRALQKLVLNSFWGFFGLRGDNPTHEIIMDFESLMKIESDPERTLESVEMIGDYLLVSHKPKIEPPGAKTSVLVAAFTTAWGRVKINRLAMELGRNLIYMDTDSAFYITRPGSVRAKTGPGLGNLKNETEAEFPRQGARIVFFCACSGKSYLSITKNQQGEVIGSCLKFKGLILTSEVVPKMSKDSFVSLVKKPGTWFSVPQTRFVRSLTDRCIRTLYTQKAVRFSSSKRRLLPESKHLETLPYGWK